MSVICFICLGRVARVGTNIFDFFDSEICVGWDANCVWPYIYYDHHRSGNKAFKEVIDLLV